MGQKGEMEVQGPGQGMECILGLGGYKNISGECKYIHQDGDMQGEVFGWRVREICRWV